MNTFFGVLLCLIITVISLLLHDLPFWPFTISGPAPHPIEPIIIAIIIGILINNIVPKVKQVKSGIDYSAKKLLYLSIILLGAQLNLTDIFKVSVQALWINIVCIIVAFVLTIWLANRAKIDKKLGILIGIGTAICGGTAIIATAPIIKARSVEIAVAITTITLFGLLAIFVYPILGHLFKLNQWQFGVWAGTAIQALGQVIAAGFAYGQQAGLVGTIVKLIRLLFLAPMILGLGFWQSKQEKLEQALDKVEENKWTNYLPPFLLGFILFAILRTLGLFHDFTINNIHIHTLTSLNAITLFLLTTAMAGIGLSTDIKDFKHTGIQPFLIGFYSATILAALSLVLVLIVG